MAFATASRKPDDAQTAAPPQAQARPRQSPGKAAPLRAPEPPACSRARRRAPGPQRMPEPQRARTPSAPGRKPGSGASTEPTIGLRDANRAERRVPRALAGPSSEFPRRKIVNLVQLRSKLTILRSLKAKTRDYLRYRKAHARTTDKNVRFPLPRPRKTVCFDRQRPKPAVFRIARPESGGTTPERGRNALAGAQALERRDSSRAKVVAPRAARVAASRRENRPEPGARRQSEGRGPRARVVVPSGGTAPERGVRTKVVAPRAGSKRCRGGRGTRPMPIRRRGGTAPERGRGAVAGRAAPGRGRNAVARGAAPERGVRAKVVIPEARPERRRGGAQLQGEADTP